MILSNLNNSYLNLPAHFFHCCKPQPVTNPGLVQLNNQLMKELCLDVDSCKMEQWLAVLAGNTLPPGATPIALAYAGHQFGVFVPQLGDGRAHLLGEVTDKTGQRRDIQLKGSGPTIYSRQGDGRAPLGPVIREYIISEAMHALGIPTTRSLAIVASGDMVMREKTLPGGILTRVGNSHLRIGSFEYFAARGDTEGLKALADYAIERLYPTLVDAPDPYLALLDAVIERQAALVAKWMSVGFVHGVMNTDNTSVSGETIDYGPCAFIDDYREFQVFSSIDSRGRYAYGNQARVMHWNLACLANALLAIIDDDSDRAVEKVSECLSHFEPRYKHHWLKGMRSKLGLADEREDDLSLVTSLLALMEKNSADYTLSFRHLSDVISDEGSMGTLDSLLGADPTFNLWQQRWKQRRESDTVTRKESIVLMHSNNPVYIPRNHRIEQVIKAAINDNDFTAMRQLIKVLSHPFDEVDAFSEYAKPPATCEKISQTFCGT